ncbi:RLA class I histocompatibility antigen, alpha chain 11/11-like [Aquarana catesbeiana]|uniref:RLA class I histocompatibility antigen, alpha chain 11/11-like n=1 Tax=Aquarana catesbeiana TaxID=8400 RepID=UPI003CC9C1B2
MAFVTAPPRITITGKNINISNENVLSCAISGFYPVDIDIKWLRDGIILNNITLEKPQRDPDGTYSVRSSVTITPTEEDRERIFSCRVQHESLTAPLQEDFKLLYGDTKSSTLYTIIIPVIAGVVILIIIAAVAIFCVKRKGKNNHNEVKNQENPDEKLMSSNLQGNQGGVNSAESATKDRTGDSIRSPGCQKTTSPDLVISSEPQETKQFTDKKTKPYNKENSEYKMGFVAKRKKFFESQMKS